MCVDRGKMIEIVVAVECGGYKDMVLKGEGVDRS